MSGEAALPIAYRLRTVATGVHATWLAVGALIVYPFLPGRAELNIAVYWSTVAVAAGGGALIRSLPWQRLFESGRGMRVMYAWSVLDILLISVILAASGPKGAALAGLYSLTTIFSALSYPVKGQVALFGLTFGSYLVGMAVAGWDVTAATGFFTMAALAILAFLSSYLGRELARQTAIALATRDESDRRAQLLATVAGAARHIVTLDSHSLLDAVADAAIALRYSAVEIAAFDEDTNTHRIIASRGLPERYVRGVHPNSTLMARLVRERGMTVVVDDYSSYPDAAPELRAWGFRSVVATPIWSNRKMTAVLVAGSTVGRRPNPEEIEAFELLAIQAGAALESASRFEEERRTVAQLAEVDRMKDDFLSTVSHELRTPLTAITAAGVTLEQRWESLEPDLRMLLLSRLNANAYTLEAIITSLLDFSRMQGGHPNVALDRVDLGSVIEASAARVMGLFADHALAFDIAGGLVVNADPMLLDRVVENLLSNAAKHTPAGTRVTLTAKRSGDAAEVTVADNGPGIPPEEMEHLADRFFRGKRASSKRTRGLGLGLSLVREILKLHGSEILIETPPGGGVAFSFRLALETVGAAAVSKP